MRSRLHRLIVSIGAVAALAASALVTTAGPARAADPEPGTGDLTLSIVDPSGALLGAMYYIVPAGSDQIYDGRQLAGTTVTQNLPVGRYGILALSPWGGMLCAGLTPCNLLIGSETITVAGVVDVPDQGAVSYRIKAPATATLVGKNQVGSPRGVDFSTPMDNLLGIYGVGVYGSVTPQWLRDGKDIAGATANSYTITSDDVGHRIAPRLRWSGYMAAQFTYWGIPAAPKTIAGQKVGKVKTKTQASVFRQVVKAGRGNSVRIDVTGGRTVGVVTGKIKVRLGSWKRTLTLRNGSTRTEIPAQKVGRHTVKVAFLGSRAFAPSDDKVSYRVS